MKKLFFVSVCSLLSMAALAQTLTAEKLGWKPMTLPDGFTYYVSSANAEQTKPVLLYLDGSGPYPLYQNMQGGYGSTVMLPTKELSKKYHIILVPKPGVPFIDSVAFDEENHMPVYPAPAKYTQELSLDWRVNTANRVLKHALGKLPVNKKHVVILGISEGFQVGSKLLATNKSITHAILMVGNGLNQFYDFIIQNRNQAAAGQISAEEAQQNIDYLYATAKAIYAAPNATDKEWYGHTYKRWGSFCQNIPVENLMQTKARVYIYACSNDQNTSVLSTDYIYLEALRRGKTNIHYTVLPYDHYFNEYITNENGEVTQTKPHMTEVMEAALKKVE